VRANSRATGWPSRSSAGREGLRGCPRGKDRPNLATGLRARRPRAAPPCGSVSAAGSCIGGPPS
jgi:hypothetical protein